MSMFADDMAVYVPDRNKLQIIETMQESIKFIAEWSDKWKMTISAEKCETSTITISKQHQLWSLIVKIGNKDLQMKKTA